MGLHVFSPLRSGVAKTQDHRQCIRRIWRNADVDAVVGVVVSHRRSTVRAAMHGLLNTSSRGGMVSAVTRMGTVEGGRI